MARQRRALVTTCSLESSMGIYAVTPAGPMLPGRPGKMGWEGIYLWPSAHGQERTGGKHVSALGPGQASRRATRTGATPLFDLQLAQDVPALPLLRRHGLQRQTEFFLLLRHHGPDAGMGSEIFLLSFLVLPAPQPFRLRTACTADGNQSMGNEEHSPVGSFLHPHCPVSGSAAGPRQVRRKGTFVSNFPLSLATGHGAECLT